MFGNRQDFEEDDTQKQDTFLLNLYGLLDQEGEGVDRIIDMCKSDQITSYHARALLVYLPITGIDDAELNEVLRIVAAQKSESAYN